MSQKVRLRISLLSQIEIKNKINQQHLQVPTV